MKNTSLFLCILFGMLGILALGVAIIESNVGLYFTSCIAFFASGIWLGSHLK